MEFTCLPPLRWQTISHVGGGGSEVAQPGGLGARPSPLGSRAAPPPVRCPRSHRALLVGSFGFSDSFGTFSPLPDLGQTWSTVSQRCVLQTCCSPSSRCRPTPPAQPLPAWRLRPASSLLFSADSCLREAGRGPLAAPLKVLAPYLARRSQLLTGVASPYPPPARFPCPIFFSLFLFSFLSLFS